MKQLYNNFTNLEQSKMLLKLCVPADSADCYYYEEGNVCSDSTPNVVPFGEVWTDESKETIFSSYVDIPCWSVGRLFEIIAICLPAEIIISTDEYPYVLDNILQVIEDCIEEFDFSKLED